MKNLHLHTLGYPRIGAARELKFALEACWRGDLDAPGLAATAAALRARHWQTQRDAGLDFVTVGDFALYDHVLDHIELFGCAPARFGLSADTPALERLTALARGSDACCGTGALALTKWFDTNYHYLVPEFDATTTFTLHADALLAQVAEARALGHAVKVALLGPLTFLWLGKRSAGDRLDLLDALLPVYGALLARLHAAGAAWVQIDEPILGLDLPPAWRNAFEPAYWQLSQAPVPLLLATYFSPLEENLSLACRLPVAGVHVDGVRAAHELTGVADWLPVPKVLSVGIVDGRNVWRTDIDAALAQLRPLLEKRGALWLAPSCSLLHVPCTLADDAGVAPEVGAWLAGADEKLAELALLRRALAHPPEHAADPTLANELAQARARMAARAQSRRVHRADIAPRMHGAGTEAASLDRRGAPYAERRLLQQARLNLPAYPTTTIGSFPQTSAIRAARAAHRRGDLDDEGYTAAMRAEIAHVITRQEALGLDVLVHGEPERNDMVEYFGAQLDGCALTHNGWVQSYGTRCVKPPIIHGDVARRGAMTVAWSRYAQSLTARPVKGMLTGPVTLLQWSFVRADQPRSATALQLALALRDEVAELEAAGIGIIQVDEPALREGLPLRRAQHAAYLDWATRAFRVATGAAAPATQIHTHMCYAEFGAILPAIAALDADVLTVEASRSAMGQLGAFDGYPYDLGPGVFDIHSPQVPPAAAMIALLRRAAVHVDETRLWVNPDCGLKTRGWAEVEASLTAMVAAARALRASAGAGSPAAQGTAPQAIAVQQ